MRYIVLGMHKSGTTLVARTLHMSGIIMGQEYPDDASYADVKFEAKNAQAVSDGILGLSRKVLSLDVTSVALPAEVDEVALAQMREMIADMDSRYQDWGFKDPRAALTYGFWKPELGEHKVVYIYRDPVEVWRRYARVNHKWWSRKAFKVWLDYNQSIMKHIDVDDPDVIVINFERLLSSDEDWQRLQKFSGRELVDVRDHRQSRFSVAGDKRSSLRYRLLEMLAGRDVRDCYRKLESVRNGAV